MSEIILPRWDGRFNATRKNKVFSDAAGLMTTYYYFYERIYNALAPYEARQRDVEEGHEFNYVAPSVAYLRNLITRGRIPESQYEKTLPAIVEFCKINRGQFAMPVPHPTTVHSIQLPKGNFKLTRVDDKVIDVFIDGLQLPMQIEGLRHPEKVQHLVVRPKSSASGVPNVDRWEVLTFEEPQGYIPLWVDSTANPRFAGSI